MHYDDWNGSWGSGGLVLMGLMMLMMLLLWGGVIWVVVTMVLRRSSTRDTDNPPPQQAPTARALLDERLARGDVDVEDYRARVEALGPGASDR